MRFGMQKEWTRWFAWYPVFVDDLDKYVWFEFLYRKHKESMMIEFKVYGYRYWMYQKEVERLP